MALSFSSGMTLISHADNATNWATYKITSGGTVPTLGLSTDVVREGIAAQSMKPTASKDCGIAFNYYADKGATLNLTTAGNEVIGFWLLITSAATLATIANGGVYLLLMGQDAAPTATNTWAKWYIGGSDNIPIGWSWFAVDTRKTPTATSGSWVYGTHAAAVYRIAWGTMASATVPKADSFFVDASWYGRPIYTLNGDGSTVATWNDLLTQSTGEAKTGAITIDVNATNSTYTRTAGGSGSFITDGFKVGQRINFGGFTNTGNNVTQRIISNVSATVITVTSNTGMVTETGTGDEEINKSVIGLIQNINGSYQMSCGLQIGTDAQSSTTTLTDSTNTALFWKRYIYYYSGAVVDSLNYSDYYTIKANGAASAKTALTLGTVVGTGDNRQGVLGGRFRNLDQVNVTVNVDFQSDMAHLSACNLYGVTFNGINGGIKTDNGSVGTESNLIACQFINCGEIDPGSTSNGSVVLNCFLINPSGGTAANRGILMHQTHNIKKLSCVTSGSPSIQHFVRLADSGTYSVAFNGIIFYGDYSSANLWHGECSSTNASAVTQTLALTAGSGSNPDTAEFEVTGTNITKATSTSVTVGFVVTNEAGTGIDGARAYIDNDNQSPFILDTITSGGGLASDTYSGGTVSGATWRVRKYGYYPFNQLVNIGSDNITLYVTLVADPLQI